MHLVERMLEALEGEWTPAARCARRPTARTSTSTNEKRMIDPSLEAVPGCGDHRRVPGAVRQRTGQQFIDLCWRIVRQGRSLHVFLQLAGQTVDVHRCRRSAAGSGSSWRCARGPRRTRVRRSARRSPRTCPKRAGREQVTCAKDSGLLVSSGRSTPRRCSSRPLSPARFRSPRPEPGSRQGRSPRRSPKTMTPARRPSTDGQEPSREPQPVSFRRTRRAAADAGRHGLASLRPPARNPSPAVAAAAAQPAAADELVGCSAASRGRRPRRQTPAWRSRRHRGPARQHRQDVHTVDLLAANGLVIGHRSPGYHDVITM